MSKEICVSVQTQGQVCVPRCLVFMTIDCPIWQWNALTRLAKEEIHVRLRGSWRHLSKYIWYNLQECVGKLFCPPTRQLAWKALNPKELFLTFPHNPVSPHFVNQVAIKFGRNLSQKESHFVTSGWQLESFFSKSPNVDRSKRKQKGEQGRLVIYVVL